MPKALAPPTPLVLLACLVLAPTAAAEADPAAAQCPPGDDLVCWAFYAVGSQMDRAEEQVDELRDLVTAPPGMDDVLYCATHPLHCI